VKLTQDPKKSCSFVTTVLLALFKETGGNFSNLKFPAEELAEVIVLTNKDELSSTNAKAVVEELYLN
jgi:Asp-tRNA(Asn)/Glu-tRNA(Gln) amidotransferase B subunit